jgi:hypothetical protein
MKKLYLFTAASFLCAAMHAQTFSNASNLLPSTYYSGGVTGVMDANNDGLDDIIIMDESNHLFIAYQQPNGTFSESDFGMVSNEAQWGMCVGDIDNDGHVDVMSGAAYDGVHIVNINAPGNFLLSTFQDVQIFMQACNFGDINNDGWVDGFACHDDGPSYRFRNTSGTFTDGNDMFDYNVYPGSDMSGNYGSVFCDVDRDRDIDLMVAKCRQFISDPLDPRRTNMIFINDGNNNYEDQAHERGLVNLQQSWTADFGDIDNDGDFDCLITTHSGTLEVYENDGLGFFTNITEGCFRDTNGSVLPNNQISGFFLQGKFVDFDNDGFLDIIHSGGVHYVYRNNGNHTFNRKPLLFPSNDTMHAFATGDLNHDGWVDLYANYGDGYVSPDYENADRLFINDGGTNHWVAFDLEGTLSNKQAIGAIVEIFGPWGRQVREVRAGESYGITTTAACMFGLGTSTSIDYAIVYWPEGGTYVIDNPEIDTYHEVVEGECNVPAPVIQADGPLSICPGSSITLSASSIAGSYLWSTGATSSTIEVNSPGVYNLISYDQNGCAASSNSLVVEIETNETPTITVEGELEFCEGNSLVLSSSTGASYSWSSGESSQSISVTESGSYAVTISSECGSSTSETLEVVVYPAAATPVAQDVTLNTPGTATLTATGSDVRWYDALNSATPVATGNTFETPVLTDNTSYWVEDVTTYGGINGDGGKLTNDTGNGAHHNSSTFYNLFDAYEDIIIRQVKVYAGTQGSRTIQVVGADGSVVANGTFSMPAGESYVNLNFFVPAGTGYGLRCTNSNPQLWRDRDVSVPEPYDYPYALGTLGAITGTNVQGDGFDNQYYFFYDWKVETPSFECASERAEVQVIFVGIDEITGMSNLTLFPNPAIDQLNLAYSNTESGLVQIRVVDMFGKTVVSDQVFAALGQNNYTLPVSNLAAGMYRMQLMKDGKMSVLSFVVE